ncbi:D-alanyl-D-alanine carboxypeptidase [Candidatus Giovannonibacteria bacterium]|nr:D-alanyl-D-alanine carboxypeptidase [Candidatus Giovannonibacteria bacterium]
MPKPKLIISFAVVVLMAALFLPAQSVKKLAGAETQPAQVYDENPPPAIEAKGGLAVDFVTGKTLYEKNKSDKLPLASVTKIISLLAIMDRVGPDEAVEISENAVLTPEPSSLRAGEHLKAKDLIAMAMTESSNDAVSALVEHTAKKYSVPPEDMDEWFLGLMRAKAASLGSPNMIFYDPTGLDVDESLSGAYGSAEELLSFAKAALSSPLWQFGDLKAVISAEGFEHNLITTNELYPKLTNFVGAKTGYTDLAGGNLLTIIEYPLGNPVGIVVLGSSKDGRFLDTQRILEWIKTSR